MNLAIKGHKTRGKEVIEILKMLGGTNPHNYSADSDSLCFYIGDFNIIYYDWINNCEDIRILSIEEFEEKFPYKVRDKVYNIIHNENQKITALVWDDQENEVVYQTNNNEYLFVNYLRPYKEETMEEKGEIIESKFIVGYVKESNNRYRIVLNHEFDMEVDEGEYYAVRRKPQYPKTYEECCEVLGYKPDEDKINCYQGQLIELFVTLLICRDAYWRMAGDWKYDVNKIEDYFLIVNKCGRIVKEHYMSFNHILAFPTAEIRDTFFENFKELIEICKELL